MDFLGFISQQRYDEFWRYLLTVVLEGFWIRFLAFISLVLGLWLMLKKRNFITGFILIILSITFTYLTAFIKFLFF